MKVLALLVFAALFVTVFAQQQCPRCTPLCQNGDGSEKVCGDDGCGGSCGTCAAGESCCRGACACQAVCEGRNCGDDGCGYESCGRCSSTQTCQNGVCTGTAVAECAGRVCGNNRAGGSCGTCPAGQRCRNGACECYYDCNERNCGSAVQPAGTNFGLCPQSSCGTCPTGFSCNDEGRCSALVPCNVNVRVVDCVTRASVLSTSSISIVSTALTYTGSLTVTAGGTTVWETPGLGSFDFSTSANGYLANSETFVLDVSTTEVELCLSPSTVLVDVRDRATDQSIAVSASVSYSGFASGQFNWNGVTTWTHAGYGTYTLVATPSSIYGQGSVTIELTPTVTMVIIYVDTNSVLVDVRNRATDTTIEVSAQITFSGFASGSFSWNGVTTWNHMGFGQYTLMATPASVYTTGETSVLLDASVSLIIIYVDVDIFCGDGLCNGAENFDTCEPDCVALFLEFENADGSGPVNAMRVNFFLSNPRDLNQATGPNRNGAVAVSTRETGSASNTVYQGTYSYNTLVYFEAVVTGFINFYWRADTGNIDPGLGSYRLRVHSSQTLGATNFNYRTVNTWKPIDATPEPFGPTDLNLHLFHPQGALDINNPSLLVGGFSVGRAVADSKQSGGPATMDISPGTSNLVAIWNSKPPRSRAIAPSQAGRYLVNSGSYIVIYGKTSNAATGKQLGQIVLDQLFLDNPSRQNDQVSDLWYAGTMLVNNPGQDQPTITAIGTLKAGTITSQLDLVFDCEAYAYCSQFVVPYSDTGR